MPVIYQKWIMRADLQRNRSVLYLFGDNELRVGLGGQAKEMRGEFNAVGVRTKAAPGMGPDDFWNDDRYDECVDMINEDLSAAWSRLNVGGIVVVPLDGLGTGLSQLPARAPLVYEYLMTTIELMEKF